MRSRLLCSLSFALGACMMFSINAIARNEPYGDNIFCWFSDVPENSRTNTVNHTMTRLSGTGGIVVNTVLTGGSKFRTGHYEVTIDGSGIAPGGNNSEKVDHDFNAVVGTTYFVSKSATCTLPSASNITGREILVWNVCPGGGTISYESAPSQHIFGKKEAESSNSETYKLDRFMSDGSNWLKE